MDHHPDVPCHAFGDYRGKICHWRGADEQRCSAPVCAANMVNSFPEIALVNETHSPLADQDTRIYLLPPIRKVRESAATALGE